MKKQKQNISASIDVKKSIESNENPINLHIKREREEQVIEKPENVKKQRIEDVKNSNINNQDIYLRSTMINTTNPVINSINPRPNSTYSIYQNLAQGVVQNKTAITVQNTKNALTALINTQPIASPTQNTFSYSTQQILQNTATSKFDLNNINNIDGNVYNMINVKNPGQANTGINYTTYNNYNTFNTFNYNNQPGTLGNNILTAPGGIINRTGIINSKIVGINTNQHNVSLTPSNHPPLQ